MLSVEIDSDWTINVIHQGACHMPKNICLVDLIITFIISKFENRPVYRQLTLMYFLITFYRLQHL